MSFLTFLSMLYHTARISLNLPRIARHEGRMLSLQRPELLPEAFNICDGSVETIIGIIRRFETQHTLQNAPLVFIHGVTVAADALLKLFSYRSPGDRAHLLMGDSPFTAFDAALTGLSHAWKIAIDVRDQLQISVAQMQQKAQFSHSHSVPVSALPSPPDFPPDFYSLPLTNAGSFADLYESHTNTRADDDFQALDLRYLEDSNLQFDISTVFSYDSGTQNSDISQQDVF